MRVNLQDFEESDIYDLEPWSPSASMPWSFLYSSFTPEPIYWNVLLPWEDNPYDIEVPQYSNEDYCEVDRRHIMCAYQGPTVECSAKVVRRELNEGDRTAVVDRLNQLRRKVAKGQESRVPGLKQAANMQKLEWSGELAAFAQRLADKLQCDDNFKGLGLGSRPIKKMDETLVGFYQNKNVHNVKQVQQSDSKLQDAMVGMMQRWYNFFFVKRKTKFSDSKIYRLVWADTTEVGCGVVHFQKKQGEYRTVMVCTFAEDAVDGEDPWVEGVPCSGCDDGQTCEDGLCY